MLIPRTKPRLWKPKVKDNTPVKTGHLRNEWHVGSIEKRGNEYYIEVYNNVEYVEPVEYGHQTRGGKGFVKGAHMMELSLQVDYGTSDYSDKKCNHSIAERD